MGLKDIGSKLPPGFRFHPSDEELVCHYLCNKIKAKSMHHDDVVDDDGDDDDDVETLKNNTDLVEIDLHICEPWQLPDVAKLNAKEWYFFSFRDRKYATGYRTNRATISGYWKATGKDRTIIDPKTKQLVGMRKTLVFYRNRAPNGIKTTWIMHEFRLECPHMPPKEDWVLCRVFNKGKSDHDNNQTIRFEINDDNHEIQSCIWDELIEIPSRTTNHTHHHNHNHNQTIPCGWDQMMITSLSSSSTHGPPVVDHHESLLNMLFVEDNNNNNIIDHHYHHEKTCMASSSDGMVVSDHLQIESGGLSFDETDNNLVTFQ